MNTANRSTTFAVETNSPPLDAETRSDLSPSTTSPASLTELLEPVDLRNLLKNHWISDDDIVSEWVTGSSPTKDSYRSFSDADNGVDEIPKSNDADDFRRHVLDEIASIKARLDKTLVNSDDSNLRHLERTVHDLIIENTKLQQEVESRDAIIQLLKTDAEQLKKIISNTSDALPLNSRFSDSEWQIVSKSRNPTARNAAASSSTVINASLRETNRFRNLRCEQIDYDSKPDVDVDERVEVLSDRSTSSKRDESTPEFEIAPTARRPCVVVNPYPERQKDLRVVPGDKTYSEALTHKVLLVTDSMCGGIKRPGMIDDLRRNNINVDVGIHRHAGAQSHELCHYAKLHVEDENPHGIIVVGGTNDLPKRAGRRQLTDLEIANNLIATGQQARDQGVTNVFISGIIRRKGVYFEKRRNAINKILHDESIANGFSFIDNDNILDEHTDGLHLLEEGTNILKSNIINILY